MSRDRYIVGLEATTGVQPRFGRAFGYTNATTTEAVAVPHTLGVTPDDVFPMPGGDTRIWATDDDRQMWSDRVVVVRGDAISTKFNLLLVKF